VATDCRSGCAGITTHHDHRLHLILLVVDRVLARDQMLWLLLRYSAAVHEATAATRRQRRSTSSCLHQRGLIVARNFASCRVHKSRRLSHLARTLLLQRRRHGITHGLAHVRYIMLRRGCRAALMNATVGLELIGHATLSNVDCRAAYSSLLILVLIIDCVRVLMSTLQVTTSLYGTGSVARRTWHDRYAIRTTPREAGRFLTLVLMHLTGWSFDQVFEKSLMILAFVTDATILLLTLILGRSSSSLHEVTVTRLSGLAIGCARWLAWKASRRCLTRLGGRALVGCLASWLTAAYEEWTLCRHFLLALRFERAHRYRLNFAYWRAEACSCRFLIEGCADVRLVHRI
jgi:hypothetical protein